jgi:hypothetical protein
VRVKNRRKNGGKIADGKRAKTTTLSIVYPFAGATGLEPPNGVASYPFEMSHKFLAIQLN